MSEILQRHTSHGASISSSTSYTYYNKTFDDLNDLFLYACTHGDYMLVFDLLCSGDIKANISNRMGKSALQLAIENEHLEVVKVLLDKIPYEQFRDALLLAIYLGYTTIAQFILNHQTYRTFSGGFLDPTDPQAYDDSQFSSDITPLVLAAQYNRLPIVYHLLTKGERIKKPHVSMCSCADCIESSASDSFRQSQIRLSAYKGLSSEVYIALTYPDPILQAFQLGYELRTLAKVEHYFHKDYSKLADQLSIFAARLLNNVRGHEELEIVLNKTGLPHEEKYENLARFDLAIHYSEKTFVAHSNCQQKLTEIWYAKLSVVKNAHIFQQIIFYLGFIICYPFLAITFYIFPKSKIGSFCQQPNLKFKAYIASYVIFMSLIIASKFVSDVHLDETEFLSNYSTIYTNYIQLIYQNVELANNIIGLNMNITDSVINCDISLRFTTPNSFQIAVFIWIIGFFWNEFKQIDSTGLHVYLKVPSNFVDCSMNILYIFYFIFLYSSMICVRLAMNTFHSSDYWNNLARYGTMSDDEKEYYISKTRHVLYWINADRFYWEGADLENLADAFFAMGSVVSICRFCFLLPISAFAGPLQVVLNRTIIHIAKWIVMVLIYFISFACALFLIFSYFSVALQQNNQLAQSSYTTNSSVSNTIIYYNLTISSTAKCPDYFYQLLNQTVSLPTDNGNAGSNANTSTNFCQQTSNYDTLVTVGPYPAIYYFGQSFQSTVLTMFFTLFGIIGARGVPARGYELITLSCNKPDPSTYLTNFDEFMSNLGFILYGIFTFVCVTVLINTLIAMLEITNLNIGKRADIEWKYARSKLYMEYIRDGNSLPVPMNIFPSPTSIMNFFKRMKQRNSLKKSPSKINKKKLIENKDEYSMHLNMGPGDNTKPIHLKKERKTNRRRTIFTNEKLTYKIVIERIIKRFLLYYKDSHIGLDEVKDGFEFKEIKQDISSFRFEVLNQIDGLDAMRSTVIQSMEKLSKNFNECFDLEQIKCHLNKQKIS